MTIRNDWVDQIFARLTVRYGKVWMRPWENMDEELVKADWRDALGRLSSAAISHGLNHLPADRPPANVDQFKTLCLGYSPPFQALPPPKADPARVAEALASLKRPSKSDLSMAEQCILNIDAAALRRPLTHAQREMRASCVRKVAGLS